MIERIQICFSPHEARKILRDYQHPPHFDFVLKMKNIVINTVSPTCHLGNDEEHLYGSPSAPIDMLLCFNCKKKDHCKPSSAFSGLLHSIRLFHTERAALWPGLQQPSRYRQHPLSTPDPLAPHAELNIRALHPSSEYAEHSGCCCSE